MAQAEFVISYTIFFYLVCFIARIIVITRFQYNKKEQIGSNFQNAMELRDLYLITLFHGKQVNKQNSETVYSGRIFKIEIREKMNFNEPLLRKRPNVLTEVDFILNERTQPVFRNHLSPNFTANFPILLYNMMFGIPLLDN